MNMTLTAVFEEVSATEGGGYVAYVEELPGAISEGDTLEEARENLRDAIAILVETNRELNSKSRANLKFTREPITVSLA
jgi:predicted RNase H-like HicB family nuclease